MEHDILDSLEDLEYVLYMLTKHGFMQKVRIKSQIVAGSAACIDFLDLDLISCDMAQWKISFCGSLKLQHLNTVCSSLPDHCTSPPSPPHTTTCGSKVQVRHTTECCEHSQQLGGGGGGSPQGIV